MLNDYSGSGDRQASRRPLHQITGRGTLASYKRRLNQTGESAICFPRTPFGSVYDTSSGAFNVWRITAKKRMVAKLNVIKAELQHRKHHRTSEVGAWLRKVVQGYYQYHAVPGNTGQLRVFRRRVCRLWRSVLVRRSQRAQVGWDRLNPLLDRWIPAPRALHPYPDKRFDAIHPR